jgi:hypothetical protein
MERMSKSTHKGGRPSSGRLQDRSAGRVARSSRGIGSHNGPQRLVSHPRTFVIVLAQSRLTSPTRPYAGGCEGPCHVEPHEPDAVGLSEPAEPRHAVARVFREPVQRRADPAHPSRPSCRLVRRNARRSTLVPLGAKRGDRRDDRLAQGIIATDRQWRDTDPGQARRGVSPLRQVLPMGGSTGTDPRARRWKRANCSCKSKTGLHLFWEYGLACLALARAALGFPAALAAASGG